MSTSITIAHPVKVEGVNRVPGETVVVTDDILAKNIVASGYATLAGATLVTESLFSEKTVDQAVATNSVALVDITSLALALSPNRTYDVDGFIVYDGVAANDGQIKWVLPAGAAAVWTVVALDPAATAAPGLATFDALTAASARVLGSVGAGTKLVAQVRGRITIGATGGACKLQGAQAVAAAATVFNVFAGSFLRASRMSG